MLAGEEVRIAVILGGGMELVDTTSRSVRACPLPTYRQGGRETEDLFAGELIADGFPGQANSLFKTGAVVPANSV